MAKPAYGTGLDPANPLYPHLTATGAAVWALLRGTGSTDVDSSGNGNTLTLDTTAGHGVAWGTDSNGPVVTVTGASNQPLALASTLIQPSSASWSLAVGVNKTGSDINGFVLGRTAVGTPYLWLYAGGNTLYFSDDGANTYSWSIAGLTGYHDILIVSDHAGGKIHCYIDGVEQGTGIVSANLALTLDTLGNGDTGVGGGLTGSISYMYVAPGYAATATDATNIHSNPYSIFLSSAASVGMVPIRRRNRTLLRM